MKRIPVLSMQGVSRGGLLATLSVAAFLLGGPVACSEDPEIAKQRKLATEAAAAQAAIKSKEEAALAALQLEEVAAQKAVLAVLNDPESARFGAFNIVEQGYRGIAACLTVNAKNGFGGYVGNREAMLVKKSGQWHAIQIGFDMGGGREVSHEYCLEQMKFSAPTILRR